MLDPQSLHKVAFISIIPHSLGRLLKLIIIVFGYFVKGLATSTAKSPGYCDGSCCSRSIVTLQNKATGLLIRELGSEEMVDNF